jgi:hypothetical protein
METGGTPEYRTLPHGRLEFTLADGSLWVFRKVGTKDIVPVMPLPTPATPPAEGEGEIKGAEPEAVARGELLTSMESTEQVCRIAAVKPRIVAEDAEAGDGEAYIYELGQAALGIARVILDESGFTGDIQPFRKVGERADA